MGVRGLVAEEAGGNRNGRLGTPWSRKTKIQGKDDEREKEEIPGENVSLYK